MQERNRVYPITLADLSMKFMHEVSVLAQKSPPLRKSFAQALSKEDEDRLEELKRLATKIQENKSELINKTYANSSSPILDIEDIESEYAEALEEIHIEMGEIAARTVTKVLNLHRFRDCIPSAVQEDCKTRYKFEERNAPLLASLASPKPQRS